MRRLLCVSAVLALLTVPLASCGDDGDETLTGATEATETSSGSASGGGVSTAGDFIDASIPDQVKAVQNAVSADPDCKGIDAKAGGEFQVAVAIDAASASADTPLTEVVGGQCSEN